MANAPAVLGEYDHRSRWYGKLDLVRCWPSTLLGPEDSDTPWVVVGTRTSSLAGHLVGGWWGVVGPSKTSDRYLVVVGDGLSLDSRPYVENCTVDASIFVAKFLRAHGGCLGTRNRRRT